LHHHHFPTRRSSDLIAHEDDIVIAADFAEHLGENFAGILPVAAKKLFISLGDASGRFEKALARWIVTRPGNQRANGGFGLFAARSEEHTSELQSREN